MKYRIGYVVTNAPTMLFTFAANSYLAFKTAIELIDEKEAFECIVYVAEGNEWVKVANVRKN
jgi:hypothetical protein